MPWEHLWALLAEKGWKHEGAYYVPPVTVGDEDHGNERFSTQMEVREHLREIAASTSTANAAMSMIEEEVSTNLNVMQKVQFVTRVGTVAGKSTRVKVKALSTQQLRTYLPEFSLNMFFDRLVRVFSETGEQKLTLLELIDLYSALSPRAPTKWKCKILFCVFDFDEVRARMHLQSLYSSVDPQLLLAVLCD